MGYKSNRAVALVGYARVAITKIAVTGRITISAQVESLFGAACNMHGCRIEFFDPCSS